MVEKKNLWENVEKIIHIAGEIQLGVFSGKDKLKT